MLGLIKHLDHVSPWLIGLALVALLSVVIEAGFRLARKLRNNRGIEKHPVETSVTGTITGLLAFMLAFTFGGSVSRYSDVRSLALADTIAIENAFIRTDFLADAERVEARQLLIEYHQLRLNAIATRDQSQINQAMQGSVEMHQKLWNIAVRARTRDDSSILNQFVSSVGELSNAHTRRVHKALVTRLPPVLWGCLLFLAALASFLLGMSSGFHGRRSRFAATAMLIGFCSVIVLIIDLDRPVRSLFQITDNTAQALLERMEQETGEP
jgi:hypothetical protein